MTGSKSRQAPWILYQTELRPHSYPTRGGFPTAGCSCFEEYTVGDFTGAAV